MYVYRPNILELTYDLKKLTVDFILLFTFISFLGNECFKYMEFVFRLPFFN